MNETSENNGNDSPPKKISTDKLITDAEIAEIYLFPYLKNIL